MNLQELLGSAYREDMTIEEIQQALLDVKMVDKSHFDRLSSEVASYKKQVKDLETQGMTEQQRLEQEAKEKEVQLTEVKQKLARLSARTAFLEEGLNETQFKPFLDLINTEVESDAIKTAKSIAQTLNSQKSEIEKSVKSQILKETPKPDEVESDNDDVMTKEQFEKLSVAERVELKQNNYELFKTLNAE